MLREQGGEYGATTGRPRRCGWLDLVVLRHAVRVNGMQGLILTKLDVLDGMEKLKVCYGYKYNGVTCEDFPKDLSVLERCEPVYREISGWKESTTGIRNYEELPAGAKAYIRMIEEDLGISIDIISTGPRRDEIIVLKDHFV
jgi:adenylosuccinate synthase